MKAPKMPSIECEVEVGVKAPKTEGAERVRPVALEVPVVVKKTGQKDESHVVYLSQDEVESTAVDIANIVCGDDGHYENSNAGSIGARRMPASYSCQMNPQIASRTGWTNVFAICCDDQVVYGQVDGAQHNAAQGEAVQLVCADPQ